MGAVCAAMLVTLPALGQQAQPDSSSGRTGQVQAQPQPRSEPRGRFDYIAARLTGGPANISGGKNVGTRAGVVTKTKESDVSGGSGFAVGFDWQKFGWSVRSEIDYNLTYRFDYDARPALSTTTGFGLENNLRTHAFMVNAYYDIKNRTRWTPYLGVGVGLARNESNVKYTELAEIPGKRQQNQSTVQNNLLWSAGLGVRYALTERWSVETGYRFMNFGKTKVGPLFDGTALEFDKYYIHQLMITANFHF